MTESKHLSELLLPELEQEFEKTRKMISYLPDGPLEFKPHEKSYTLTRLAGHTSEIAGFISMILTSPMIELSAGGLKSLAYESKPQLLAGFNEQADGAVTAMKNTLDETFDQSWKLAYKGHAIFDGTRYNAYRQMGLNHMVHHRAQLGVYLRLLNAKVPSTFGPSADEPFGG